MIEGKNVVFVNISAYSFITHKDYIFEKLEKFFYFIHKETKLISWFRPHPNLKEELKQYSDVYDRYIAFEEKYIALGWGEFDERQSIDYAYSVADIYYGDYGTVMKHCEEMGLQIIVPNYYGLFFPIGICKSDGYIYGTHHDNSAIMRFNISEGIWEYAAPNPGFEKLEKAFHKSFSDDHKIYFIPYKAGEIVEYDTKDGIISKIELKLKKEYISASGIHFFGYFRNQHYLYIIPVGYKKMLKINVNTKEVMEACDFDEITNTKERIKWLSWVKLDSDVVAIASCNSNEVMFYDMSKDEYEIKYIGGKDVFHNSIRKYKEEIILVGKNKAELKILNYQGDYIKTIPLEGERLSVYGISIFDDHATIIYKDKLFCFPANSKKAIIIDLPNYEVRPNFAINKYINENDERTSQFDTVTSEGRYVYIQHQSMKFLVFDMEDEKVVLEAECRMSAEDTSKMERDIILGILK